MSLQAESVQLKDNTDLQIQRIIEKHEKKMETQGLEEPRKRHRLSCMEEESQRERSRVQLVKQIAAILKQGDMRYTKDGLHRTFQDDDLLERIFRLFCDEEHLVQEEWIESLKERLQEDKQLDFVEQVESVAYVLCGDGVVTKETFSKIWKNKVVTNKLFRAVEGGSGWVSAADLVDLITAATDNRTRAGIDKESLDRLERLFKETVGDQREITREQFQKIVVSKNHFNHSGVVSRQHMWMLSNVPQLDKFKYVIKDSEQLDLVEEVIEEFKYAVIPQMEELEKGVIHGDINEMNVLVALKEGSKSDYRISGILDFGDIQHSCVLFELSVCMTYAMLVSGPRAGGVVLAGWSVTRRLTDQEYRLLKPLVSARLVQSLVLGAYTREQEPENKYVSSTEKAKGWELLKKIRKNKPDPEDDCTNWKDIANDFLTRS